MNPPAEVATAAEGALSVDAAHAVPADLTVDVVDRARDDQTFVCTVTSPWLDDFREKQPEEWLLDRRVEDLVKDFMAEFTTKDVELGSRLLSLKGAGALLWKYSAPQRFRDAYKALVEQGRPPQTIQVISQEKNIPWELMLPQLAGDDDIRPLGVRASVARWFDGSALRTTGTPVADARVVAPSHDQPPKLLPKASEEADFVCKRVGGEAISPATPSHLETILENWTGTLLHFVCHGQDGTTQAVLLDGKEKLTSVQVAGMLDLPKAWSATAPIVFLNACDVGRAAPALNGSGGLARAWIDAGAGAVIAPLWSVRDTIAHEVALHFYKQVIAEPESPYADIVRDIRAIAYKGDAGEDTYAAYCYFGSPHAAARAG